jgi:two-component system, OmpR family, KDP operon response regulator KdpE
VYVRQLRIKVEVIPSRPRYIVTEPGIGYVFRVNVIVQNI